jgi:DNA-binding IclR family transcriptional regulator
VLLAYHPEPEIDAYLQAAQLTAMTPKTIVDRERLKRNLMQIRAQGYALDDEERELGLRCIAAPITDQTGRVTASVSISAPSIRLSVEGALAAVPKVKDCARLISRMLGSPMLTDSMTP